MISCFPLWPFTKWYLLLLCTPGKPLYPHPSPYRAKRDPVYSGAKPLRANVKLACRKERFLNRTNSFANIFSFVKRYEQNENRLCESICQTHPGYANATKKCTYSDSNFASFSAAETCWLSQNFWSPVCVWCVGRNQRQQTVRAAAFNLGSWH